MTNESNDTLPNVSILWTTANELRKNLDAAIYKNYVLGLIFLKYISDAFDELHKKLLAGVGDFDGADPNDPDEYKAQNVFYIPPTARWSYILENAHQSNIGKIIDDAMETLEGENPALVGVLPHEYTKDELDKDSLAELIVLISNYVFKNSNINSQDVLGRVYEYFLGQFALAEGKKGGQFYTPSCLVKLLVNLLEPYKGRVFDPCCGSGGMFVQSEKFVESHANQSQKHESDFEKLFNKSVSIYGQESNIVTWKLCKMNLAIRGIDSSNILWNNEGSFKNDAFPDLKADYIIANPPFNDKAWYSENLKDDYRWTYGLPAKKNGNYAWIQHFISHLSVHGKAGFLLSVKSLASSGDVSIRKKMVTEGLPECIVLLPKSLFYSTPAPVSLWILSKTPEIRQNRTLFIDASKCYTVIDRTHNRLDDNNIKYISDIYHNWLAGNEKYKDIPGLCKSVTKDEILEHQSSLYPGEYIGINIDRDDIIDSKKVKENAIKSLDNANILYETLGKSLTDVNLKLNAELMKENTSFIRYKLSDLLIESNEKLGSLPEPEILTITEKAGLVLQRERFSKRVAKEDTTTYKIVYKNDIVYNPYLLWAGAIDQCTIVEMGITSPAYKVFRIKPGYPAELIGHILKTELMKKYYWNISVGTHERRRTAPVGKFLDLTIELPKQDIQASATEFFKKISDVNDKISEFQKSIKETTKHICEFYTQR